MSAKARWLAKRARSDRLSTAKDGGSAAAHQSPHDSAASNGGGSAPAADAAAAAPGSPEALSPLVDITLTGGAELDNLNPLASTDDEEMVSWWRGQARFNVDD